MAPPPPPPRPGHPGGLACCSNRRWSQQQWLVSLVSIFFSRRDIFPVSFVRQSNAIRIADWGPIFVASSSTIWVVLSERIVKRAEMFALRRFFVCRNSVRSCIRKLRPKEIEFLQTGSGNGVCVVSNGLKLTWGVLSRNIEGDSVDPVRRNCKSRHAIFLKRVVRWFSRPSQVI